MILIGCKKTLMIFQKNLLIKELTVQWLLGMDHWKRYREWEIFELQEYFC